ncbi:hypothetical protein COCOR_04421 [Corallococcus coralloides DSM 2259]|uniref:Uncharacterized protein n=1 Tax=Corallococcus coralloides (strain ATCC 25202 / DSM 2259 / NBRC 100086 / M2) TaxID=1144275 RepID=H8MFA2_CORCM|nr:hypothetical protein [Corallococcus coralloides]AFE05822.1 hypothetical protein COCOR_04421 [Corallococcus coralloides DSM 2259]
MSRASDPKDWKTGKKARAAKGIQQRERQQARESTPKPPVFSRSRTQLATVYAPEVLFTFEGGRGICRSVPVAAHLSLDADVINAIRDGMKEFVENWAVRARTCRGNEVKQPLRLCLDDAFIKHGPVDEPMIDWTDKFAPTDPKQMGYEPWPLLYYCTVCRRLSEFSSIKEQVRNPLPGSCGTHRSQWRQLDVVFAHWSGDVQPLSPWRHHYDENTREIITLRSCQCGGAEFRIINKAPTFSEWRFQCVTCMRQRDVTQSDRDTLSELKPEVDAGNREWVEINMLPVSYRANSLHYVQSGRFVKLKDSRSSALLRPGCQTELMNEIAQLHRIQVQQPPDEEIEVALRDSGREDQWEDWRNYIARAIEAEKNGKQESAKRNRNHADELWREWIKAQIIPPGKVNNPTLEKQVEVQSQWARRFNPFRLTIEHDAVRKEHVEEKQKLGAAIDVLAPDRTLCDAVGEHLAAYKAETGDLLRKLGIDTLTFIRGLPICEYTFGYSRVSSGPIYHREYNGRSIPMPVRLKAFPRINNGKHPVYVLQQDNEALYVRLNESRVRAWLAANAVAGTSIDASETLGAAYLEQYRDFGTFLDDYRKRDGSQGAARNLPAYVYMLLHTLAHQMIHALAETSGLDTDGIGELIYPADLSFIVYRKGMTPDLGHVSAMWRNHHREFLRLIGEPRRLRCGSGSLCDGRGGACPACVMLPDVACTASNQLLSRSMVAGGKAPQWEGDGNAIVVGWLSSDHYA